jgi:hypothetical protein
VENVKTTTGMAEIAALVTSGEKLGYKGDELKDFVNEQLEMIKQQQNDAREMRVLEREKLQSKDQDRALEMERLKIEHEKLKLEEKKSEREESKLAQKIKIPTFDEKEDRFDSYISRFESIAKMRKWKEEDWPMQLSLLLTGKALDAFYALSEEEQKNYNTVKDALLRKYELTEEQFRKQFHSTSVDPDETVQQFLARLERLFSKWIESAKIKTDYKGLKDLIIREGFYQRCGAELTAYLREKDHKDLKEIVTSAQKFIDAHNYSWGKAVAEEKGGNRSMEKKPGRTQSTDEMLCTICKKTGHTEDNCWFKERSNDAERKCFRCGSPDHMIKSCTKDKVAVGSSSVHKETSLQDKYQHLTPNALGKVLNVPISEGTVNGQAVIVMRDTGFGSAAVKSKFVNKDDYLDEYEHVYLMDSSERRFQKAVVMIATDHFKGKLKVFVVDTLVVDCVIGNIEELKGRDSEHVNTSEQLSAAVVTRAQRNAEKKPLSELVVDKSDLVDRDSFMKLQKEDSSLERYWDLAGGDEKQSKCGGVKFEVRNGLLYRIFTPRNTVNCIKQLMVPERMRQKVISVAHDGLLSGHCGIRRTKDRVVSNFYWRELDQDVRRYCRSCSICQKTLKKGLHGKAPLQKMPIIAEPFKRVAVDLVGPITPCSERGHRYILTVVDYATRYPEAEVLKGIDTITVAEGLFRIFCRIGFPEEMLTDRGTQFLSDVMQEVNRLLSIKHLKTTAWHPVCNGLVERFNGTLKTILKRLCSECPKQWDRYLPAVLFAYRSSTQESSGFSPFELVFGRKARGSMEILRAYWGKEEIEEDVKTVYKYVVDLQNRLQETCKIAQEELKRAQEMHKRHYDKKARAMSLKVGQKVLLLLPTKANKLLLQWRGPYTVIEVASAVNYVIQMGSKERKFHVNMLKPYFERQIKPQGNQLGCGSEKKHGKQNRDDRHKEKTLREAENAIENEETPDEGEEDDEDGDDREEDSNGGEENSDDDDCNEEEETLITDADPVDRGVTSSVSASMVLKDGDVETELIEVCPLSSTQSWEDVKISDQLSPIQREEVMLVLQEHSDVLTTLPGHTQLEEHVITLTTDEPIRAQIYQIPYSQREVMAKEVNEMLRMKIIRPSKSPYAAPPVLVKKTDGTVRFCINYKKLNQVTVFDGEPMPCPEDVYVALRGKKYRTKMDLTKGYWQIGVHPDTIEKTAFVTPNGAYEFLRLPFGLKNSAASFNRLMRTVLRDVEGVGCFVDDIIIYSDTWETHIEILKNVFGRLRAAGLTVKPSKCTIGVTDVEFVGHRVGMDTLGPREEKVAEVLNVGTPKTKRQVKSFLAMAGYYGKFIEKFTDLAYPLTELTKGKHSIIQWGQREDAAFRKIKEKLAMQPILRIVDFSKPMYVQTDASDVGLGAALLQEHESMLHPVRYISRKLKPAERNYSTIEKEGLGVVWAIEKLQVFLYGREFVLLVDHKPLTFINSMKLQNSRIMRWSLFLQDWAFKVEAIKGVDNILADCLSRAE